MNVKQLFLISCLFTTAICSETPFDNVPEDPSKDDICELFQHEDLHEYASSIQINFDINKLEGCDEAAWKKIFDEIVQFACHCSGSDEDFDIDKFAKLIKETYEQLGKNELIKGDISIIISSNSPTTDESFLKLGYETD